MSRYHFLVRGRIKKSIYIALSLIFSSATITSFLLMPGRNTEALSGSQFNAGRIIDDAVFYNKNTMSTTQIQEFLNSKVPNCGNNCLKDYRQNTKNIAPESGLCAGYSGKSNETAAQIIYKVAQSCGINPQVILVMLQKEQGLVTSTSPSNTAYEKAMGAFCPDTAPCDPAYKGFFYQVYYGAHRFKVYRANPNSFNYKAGRNNYILYNPDTKCGGSNVYIQNQATAGLYIYTPYQPNPATLAVGLGVEAPCGAYGNKNFWWLFNIWFGPTTGTPFFRISGSSKIYIEGAGNTYYYVTSPSMMKSYGYGSTIHSVTTVGPSHIQGKTFKGNLPHIARFEDDAVFIINGGRSHHLPSRAALENYGFTLGEEATLPSGIKYYFKNGATVSEIMVRSDGSGIYLVQNGKKRHIIGPSVYNSQGDPVYATRPTVKLDSYFVNSLPSGPPIMKSGTHVQSSDTKKFWVWANGSLHPLSSNTAKSWSLPVHYSAPEQILVQLPVTNTNYGALARSADSQYFILDNRNKLLLTPGELTTHDLPVGSFQLLPSDILNLFTTRNFSSLKLVRRAGTDPVYEVKNNKLFHIYSRDEAHHFNINLSSTITINKSTFDLFDEEGNLILMGGRLIRNGDAAEVYMIDTESTKRHVPSRDILQKFGYQINDVISVTESGFQQYETKEKLQNLVKYTDGSYWLIENNSRHKIPTSLFAPFNYQDSNFLKISRPALTRINPSRTLTPFLASASGAVYKIEGGKKRWYATKSAFERGRSWSDVRIVSESYLNSFPNGKSIR